MTSYARYQRALTDRDDAWANLVHLRTLGVPTDAALARYNHYADRVDALEDAELQQEAA